MIREHWRVALLVVLLVASGVAMFAPGVAGGTSGPTNLQYGLDLSGGTRIRAPLEGVTAEGVTLGEMKPEAATTAIANELPNTTSEDIVFRLRSRQPPTYDLEVRSNVSQSALKNALDAVGLSAENVRTGVTEETRSIVVRTIQQKIAEVGFGDRSVQSVFSATENQYYIMIEVPNRNQSEVRDLIDTRGKVRILAYHSTQRNGTTVFTNRTALVGSQLTQIGLPKTDRSGQPYVPVTVKSSAAPEFQEIMVETGIAQRTSTECGWPGSRGYNGQRGPCLLVVVDDKVVGSFGMSGGLGRSMVSGSWADDPRFQLQTTNMSEARELSINLRAGALPVQLNLDNGTASYIAPSHAEDFKLFALITGIIAVIAVAVVVFLRYGDPAVSAPMVVTALSEVVILLGFAAVTGLALDLSHLAGFIAVIGTGVDDLIIIADEVMSEGEISGGKVFENRFRKAFWIIGAAAATTVIAMSPLAFLQLGDLRGFALVTILGVFVGVLVTRPAYGDILRAVLTER